MTPEIFVAAWAAIIIGTFALVGGAFWIETKRLDARDAQRERERGVTRAINNWEK